MCDNCKRHRTEVKADLVALLMGDTDNRLTIALNEHVERALPEIHARIDEAIDSGRVKGDKPDDDEIREALRDALMGAVLATGAASLAAATPGYTDEGKQPCSMILGMWAGAILANEMEHEMQGRV